MQFLNNMHQQPSETSTNNLLMYSQSVKLEGDSTIHNINTSLMNSELNARLNELHAPLDEQEKTGLTKLPAQDLEMFKRLKEFSQHSN